MVLEGNNTQDMRCRSSQLTDIWGVLQAGMVFFDKVRYEDYAATMHEASSCISFVHEGPSKKLLAFSVED
ncbi:hypothetical protein NECAME_12645 [Necator americanus]|uniref:Uncharacterized protein n=1 Tax=Necator americanus TaxID=51031 RepID=W2T1P6_NECAM|nr:hypothetical protein NECAME_12645 [Necator americanus]ETN74897.1 hypothetical protein NECAME_12645 [Necator americanus]